MKYVTTEDIANGQKHIGENRSIACEADSVRLVLGELVEMVLVHKLHLLQELVEQVDH